MHRLGRETSGLVLFARDHGAAGILQEAWRGHRIEKRYRALGSGVCERDRFDVEAAIFVDRIEQDAQAATNHRLARIAGEKSVADHRQTLGWDEHVDSGALHDLRDTSARVKRP